MSKKEKFPNHFWNHRVVERKFKHKGFPTETLLAVHEAHYTAKKSKTVPQAITLDAVGVYGETLEELRDTLQRMLRSLEKPVLKFTQFRTKGKKRK